MSKKGLTSRTVTLNGLLVIIVLIVALALAGWAYHENSERVNGYYKETAVRVAAAVAAFVDGDKTEALLNAVKSDEFHEKREAAIAADNDQIMADWLRENGYYDTYKELDEILGVYREKLGVRFVYLQSLEHDTSVNIVDPDESLFYMGSLEETPDEYKGLYKSNQRIQPFVTVTEFGWLCSAYEPVTNSEGRNVAMVGVDISMDDMMAERQEFLTTMLLFAAALMVAASLGTVLLMNRSRKGEKKA